MAELGFQFCFISTLLIVCLLSSSSSSVYCSRNLADEIPKTSVLDISASVQSTLDVLSFDHSKQLQEQSIEPFDSSSEFTLQLHSRDTLHKSSAQDYKSLTLARLKRDSARVKSLNLKLDLAIKGIKKSDLKPLEEEGVFQETKAGGGELDTPIISGLSLGSGEYFARIGIGSPPQSFYMTLDTGSDVTWLQCEPCTDCYQQSDPIFKPSSSSSYTSLSCDSDQCKSLDVSACRSESCLYQVSYGDGSFTVGTYATETLTFEKAGSVSNISLGCGHDNEGLFVGAAGIIAVGGGTLAFPSQTKSSSFSYCLVDRDSSSSSTLEFVSSSSSSPPESITVPLHKNSKIDTFYYLELTGISVGGNVLPIPEDYFKLDASGSGGVIIDSGTAVTRLREEAYNILRDAFKSGTAHLPSAGGFVLFDTCYDLSSMGSSVQVPTVAFLFPGGKSLGLPAKNYLIPVNSEKTFCFAFAGTRSSLSIIGNLQQQGTRVSFDVGKSVIGFSSNKC